MLTLGQDEMAKYPFLGDAGAYLKEQGFTLEQFGTDPDLAPLIDMAFERIKVASEGGIYKSALNEGHVSDQAALPNEVFSFLLSIVLLKQSKTYTLIKRFALAESRRAEKYLQNDLANIYDESKKNLAIRIIYDLFSVQVKKIEDSFVIPVSDYLRRSTNFHEREWKLVNRHVENGLVFLSSHETIRLIRTELVRYISTKISNANIPEMISGFEKPVNRLVLLSKKFAVPATVDTGEHPPCIKHAIETLQKGENLPHSGRFMLATFLLSKGQTVSQIAPMFKNAPDYNPRVTLYQLNHLSGAGGNGTQYTCPSCEKLKVQNLCFEIPECDNIINPLQFGKKRK